MFFFKNHGPFDLNFLLKKTHYVEKQDLRKNKIKNISTLNDAKLGDITFFESIKYINDLKKTNASYCLIQKKHANELNKNCIPIFSREPLLDFILIASEFYPESKNDNYKFNQNMKFKSLTKQGTYIDKSVKIGKKFDIGINSTLKKNVIIGDNVKIGSNCVISNAIIEDSAMINDGTVIGKIGYGFKYINNKLTFIPHVGHVKIGRNTYIGSNCTIDRGSFSNTVIGSNSMLDNNIHIAHNVKIGSSCYITGQVGIAGSTILGNGCMVGGQTGISGHLRIGDNVYIGGHSGVLNNLENNSKVMGYPAVSMRDFLKGRKK